MAEPPLRTQAIRYLVEVEHRMNEAEEDFPEAEINETLLNPDFRRWQQRRYPITAALGARRPALGVGGPGVARGGPQPALGLRGQVDRRAGLFDPAYPQPALGLRGQVDRRAGLFDPAYPRNAGLGGLRGFNYPGIGLGVAVPQRRALNHVGDGIGIGRGRFGPPPPRMFEPVGNAQRRAEEAEHRRLEALARQAAANEEVARRFAGQDGLRRRGERGPAQAENEPLGGAGGPGGRGGVDRFIAAARMGRNNGGPGRGNGAAAAQRQPNNLANILALIAAAEGQEAPVVRRDAPVVRRDAPPAAPAAPQGALIAEALPFQRLLENRPAAYVPEIGQLAGFRWGMCPICLNVFEEGRAGGCLYHSHVCSARDRSDRLWNKYSWRGYSGSLTAEFCMTCGRGTEHHRHYALQAGNAKPPIIEGGAGGAVFNWDCTHMGGGGRRELIARCLGIIRFVNGYRGVLQQNKGFITQCADAAEAAAMDPEMLRLADRSIREGRFVEFVRDNLRFAPDIAPLPPVRNAARGAAIGVAVQENPGQVQNNILAYLVPQGGWRPVVDAGVHGAAVVARAIGGVVVAGVGYLCALRGAPGRGVLAQINNNNDRAPPAVAAAPAGCPPGHTVAQQTAGHCFLCQLMGDDNQPVYKFHHNKADGRDYIHTDDQLICGEHLNDWLVAKTNEGIFVCFNNVDAGCGGIIHPCEYAGIPVTADFPQETRNRYRAAYNVWAANQGLPQAGGAKRRRHRTKKHRMKKHKKHTRKH